uniref:Sodium transporter HKT1 n=2 Tax=Vitis vinifera TaxID=29760 RepID=F6I5Q6_VITVI
MMISASFVGKRLHRLCTCLSFKLECLGRSIWFLVSSFYSLVVLRVNPFWIQLCYFPCLSFQGFLVLKALKPRTYSFRPRNLDLFFTSVSAATVSSMSTVEMEVFSNNQLLILTLLMFVGGEVFTSMVELHLRRSKLEKPWIAENKIDSVTSINGSAPLSPGKPFGQVELRVVTVPSTDKYSKLETEQVHRQIEGQTESLSTSESLKYRSIKFLGFVVMGYLVVVHVVGVALVSAYVALVSSARDVLKQKGLKLFTFSLFTTVSTFASCGFVPTNENMIVFSSNSGLLLIIIPQVLLGNTLFPSCLRFSIWTLGKFFNKAESNYLLMNAREIGFLYLLPSLHSTLLVPTVLGFILIQFTLLCSMDWNSEGLNGLNSYQKIIGALFQSVNSRHTGETIVDISILSPAILVLFVVMMYLPPYTSFLPIEDYEQSSPTCSGRRRRKRGKIVENLIFSQLSYLVIFIILICITERKNMKDDPLNFTVLNIVIEVISAYGNVGFTAGYSCERLMKPDSSCQSKWFGFSGKWSDEGKIILILAMFFGRLKKFNMDGGRAWKLL